MRKNMIIGLTFILLIPGLLFTVSCAKKTNSVPLGTAGTSVMVPTEEECPPTPTKVSTMGDESAKMTTAEKAAFVNEDIYFEYDMAVITPASQAILKKKAALLRQNPGLSVTIEGHCDERGTSEYNLALGDRRARGAKSYLVDLGIEARRLSTISYGEERPLDPGHNESAWSKNRRAHFLIK